MASLSKVLLGYVGAFVKIRWLIKITDNKIKNKTSGTMPNFNTSTFLKKQLTVRWQPAEWEKIIVSHISGKVLIIQER